MDEVVSKLVALGVPGLVLLVAIAISGAAGGAAIVAALAFLGGPFGMLGGLATLALITLVSDSIGKYGVHTIFRNVVDGLVEKGKSKRQIRKEIDSYPITKGLKNKLHEHLDRV